MRDEYYDDPDEISIDDLDSEEWFDDDDPVEEPVKPRVRPERARRGDDPEDRPSRLRRDRQPERDAGRDGRERDRGNRLTRRSRDRGSDKAIDRNGQRSAAAAPAASGAVSPLNDLLLLVFKMGLVAAFLIFMTTFFFGITQARDVSMEPAIKEGDLVIYYRPDKSYVTGDAIVVDYNGKLQVRRVVAIAGDTVDISADGGLIVNGSTQIESDIYTQTLPYTDGITFPVTVGDGEVFVLGDDRTSAEDSRIYGTVSISATKGAVMTVIRRRGI